MSWDYESSDEDYPTAVAAAGYAIYSLDGSKPFDQNKKINGPDKPLNESRSKSEDSWISHQVLHEEVFSDETPKRSFEDSDFDTPAMKNRTSSSSSDSNETGDINKLSGNGNPALEKANDRAPPMKRPPSFADKEVGPTSSIKNRTSSSSSDSDETGDSNKLSGNSNPALEKANDRAPPMKSPPTFADKHLYDVGERKTPEISMADAWEKEEMASIQERHLRLIAIIDNWEMKKKRKADQKLERIKAKLEKKRAKAMQNHREERMRATVENWDIEKKKKMDREIENIEDKLRKRRKKAVTSHRDKIQRIKEVAGGAKAQADENRRNDEIKVKEKANKIKLTGKIPPTCLCF